MKIHTRHVLLALAVCVLLLVIASLAAGTG